jgi:hypothetical protein
MAGTPICEGVGGGGARHRRHQGPRQDRSGDRRLAQLYGLAILQLHLLPV